jgi:hypothetical protein
MERDRRRASTQTDVAPAVESAAADPVLKPPAVREKLSVNVNHEISERLRKIAYTYRLSESSIVEIALAIFFARGDDAVLGVMLRQLGATRRSKT